MDHHQGRNEKPPLKPRAACDRCHSQKLRCLKPKGQEDSRCQRCLSSNTECVFSPRTRSTRSRRPHTEAEDVAPADEEVHRMTAMATDVASYQAGEFDHAVSSNQPGIIDDGGMGNMDESMDLGPYCQTYQPNRKEFGSPVGAWAIPDFNDPQGFEVPGTLNAEYDFTNTNDLLDPVLHGLNTITRVELPLTAAISNPEQSNSTSPSSGDADSEEEVSIPIAHYIRKLADLNVSLHEHATTIPPQSATSDSQVAQLLAASSSGGATRKTFSTLPTQADIEKGKMFAIDQTFKLTQTLIEVLVHLYPRFDSSVVQHEADLLPFLSLTSANDSSAVAPQLLQNNPKSLHTFDSMGRSTNRLHKGQEPPPSHPPLDQGTVLLILSCYHRLVDIYEGIFGHMQACIKHSITPITEDGQTFRLPPLKVGDYVAPASAAIAMQMMLVIRMSSQLFDQMQEVMGAGNPASVDLGRDGEDVRIDSTSRPLSALTDMACQAMQIRACGMSERISSTRMMLLQSGVI